MLFAELFAQARRGNVAANPNANPNADAEFAGVMAALFGFICVVLIISLVIQFFFCQNLSKVLHAVSSRNRRVEPGQAYYFMIPLFNIVWMFLFFPKFADSLEDEYDDRGWRPKDDFCRQIGLWYGICTVASIIPYIGAIPGMAGLVLFILIWVKAYGYRKELEGNSGRRSRRDDSDDGYDDDRPRRRRRSREDDDDDDDVDLPPRRGN